MSTLTAFDGFAGFDGRVDADRSERSRAGSTPPVEPRTRLRLTRRGRVVLTSLAALPLVLWAVIAILGAGPAAAGGSTGAGGAALEVVTVGYGDTLWELALSIAPDEDPREVIADILRINGLESAVVQPGQQLALPSAP
ncbi:LysM peptidoglycan-binding domain-containing protein [Agromyces sp. CFH 90414]|uniref:LysM peptidoglycan-binding domain-containing protein n=1 Tax=Agromyces agglutinans TaxID=2662258 RepID=A0A6I2FGA9_9MICO|nr:LysM peptidoglycan-binding domain-containing protein [Agromyces agglutinans]MRG61616.1 LysM peptidoglycan-binding domain-containing protein [Agromyces agglutinans]